MDIKLKLGYDGNNKYHRFVRTLVLSVISLFIFVVIWWIISIITGSTAIPTPAETLAALIELMNKRP